MITYQQQQKIINTLKLYGCFGIRYMEPITFRTSKSQKSQDLPNSYENLREHITHCNLCELSKGNKKYIGSNDPTNSYYIVDLYHSFIDENIKNYLKYVVEDILGLHFKEVYMTNIIKCETNNIGNNHDSAASLCQEYVLQEILIQKPKYIIATASSCKYLLKTQSEEADLIGNSFKVGNSTVFPIFDFDFLSKNPSYQDEMVRVLKKIKGFIH